METAGPLRMTRPTLLVLGALLADPAREMYGRQIVKHTGLASGTTYPMLARLEGYGWVESAWEDVNPEAEGRPRRRFYRLTAVGVEQAQAHAARIRNVLTPGEG